MILTVAVADLLYACIVSPFFVENYVRLNWDQSLGYCRWHHWFIEYFYILISRIYRFYTFYFTFHDLFAPLCLIVLSVYVSLKFTGVTAELKWKRQIYLGLGVATVLFSLLLAVPATLQAAIFSKRKNKWIAILQVHWMNGSNYFYNSLILETMFCLRRLFSLTTMMGSRRSAGAGTFTQCWSATASAHPYCSASLSAFYSPSASLALPFSGTIQILSESCKTKQ